MSGARAWVGVVSRVYVLRGVALSGMGLAGLADLLWVPVYIIWKLTLRFSDRGRKPEEWVRTTREAEL